MEQGSIYSVCFTGHRDLPGNVTVEYRTLVRDTEQAIAAAYANGAREFYTGGAAGFDQLAGELVLRFKVHHPEVRLHIFLPYTGYTGKLSSEGREHRKKLLEGADEVKALAEQYAKGCFLQRDRALVDYAESCIAYLRKTPSGTAWTVSFARQKGIPVVLL